MLIIFYITKWRYIMERAIYTQTQLQQTANNIYKQHAFDMFVSCTCIGLACLLAGYMLGIYYPIV